MEYDKDYKQPEYGNAVHDLEAGAQHGDAVIHDSEIKDQNPLFRGFRKLFDSGVEARGIERVPEDERDGKHTIGLMLLWWSVNTVVSTFPIGVSHTTMCP